MFLYYFWIHGHGFDSSHSVFFHNLTLQAQTKKLVPEADSHVLEGGVDLSGSEQIADGFDHLGRWVQDSHQATRGNQAVEGGQLLSRGRGVIFEVEHCPTVILIEMPDV